jgi:hypothetical protein
MSIKVARKTKSQCRQGKARGYRKFPYERVAQMWHQGKSIAEIGRTIKRVDTDNPNGDLYHSLRNFLWRMHQQGYLNKAGRRVRLPHRVSAKTIRAARKAGLRAC